MSGRRRLDPLCEVPKEFSVDDDRTLQLVYGRQFDHYRHGEAIRKSPELAFSISTQGQKLLSQYRGRVVALEFILTTCPHCQAASKVMNGMQERYGSRGFQALDVAIDPNADLLVENFAKDYHVGFPVGWTTIEQMMAHMGFADRPAVPQLILIDRNENIIIRRRERATRNR